jgi:glycosyltransferase involved in cell wall biosynthesis
MKICFMTATVSRSAGGLFQSVPALAKSCSGFGNSVFALGVRDHYTDVDIQSWNPIPVEACPVYGPERFSFAPGLANKLEENNPDILHLHGLWRYTSIVASRWHRRTGKPYIVHPHGMLDPWAVQNAHWKKIVAGALYENRTLKDAVCIRALCQSEFESVRAYGCQNPVCILPNGVDLPDRKLARAASLWKEHEAAGRKILLYLGRLHPKKGLTNLIRAWSSAQKLPASGAQRWLLAIAGWDEGNYELELKKLCTELQLQSSVLFLGPKFGDDKSACYQCCDAFILPSYSEGLPMVILEAWSYAKPTLMTDQCNLPEGFSAGAALRISTEPESICEGLVRLFNLAPAELEELGRRGLSLAAKNFSWEKIGEQMNSICHWIVRGDPRPDCVHVV